MKTTTVTGGTCGRTLSGAGWSRLWAKAAKIGWIKGKDGRRHYCCAKCMVAGEFSSVHNNNVPKIKQVGE